MKTLIIFSGLRIWSGDSHVGAPSYYKTLDGYAKNGWKIYLIGPYGNQDLDIENIDILPIKVKNRIDVHGSKIEKFIFNILWSKKLQHEMIRIGDRLIDREKKDQNAILLYAYEVHGVLAAKKLSKKYGCKLITRFQGTMMTSKKNRIIDKIAYYPHYQALKTDADMIVMTDDGSSGKEYLEFIGNKSRVLFLRNGVDTKRSVGEKADNIRSKLGVSKEDFVVMTVSRLVNWKRVDRAVNTVADLAGRIENIKLIIIGDGSEKENLMSLSRRRGISDRVIFTGSIHQKDVSDYLFIADVFLSLYDITNVGNPSYEAMKNGKAIVTIDNGDTSSLFTHNVNALMADPDKVEEMVPEMVYKIYSDAVLRHRLENNAQTYADLNFWSWEERMEYECKEAEKLFE